MLNYAAKVISILLAEKYEYSIQSSVVRSKVVSLQNRHEHRVTQKDSRYACEPCKQITTFQKKKV